MYRLGKVSQIIGGALAVVLVFCASSVMADTITSPSYTINGNLGGNFGGQASSTSYKMTAVGGEAIVGNGASGSYKITQQAASSAQPSLNLSVQPSGLAAYYPFEENTGTITANASTIDAQATLSNGATWTTGKIGSAIYFDGVDDAVTIPSATTSLTSGRLSVTGWVKVASTSNAASYQLITDRRFDNTNTGFSISVSKTSGNIAASSTFNGASYTTSTGSTVVTDGQWHYFAYVVDDSRINIYLDGVLKAYTSYTGVLDMPTNDIRVGQSGYNGIIDELKYFDRTMSATEVLDQYTAQNAGNTHGLSFGSLKAGVSSIVPFDAIVRANTSYNLSLSQNHDMQTTSTSVVPDITEPFSAATAGNSLTTLNTSFTQMIMGAGTTAVASTASVPIHGNYATFADDGTTSYSYGRHAITSTSSRYFRFYLRLSQYPSRTMYPFQLTDSASGVLGEVAVDTAGKVRLRNQNTSVATASTSLPLNQWTRVEFYWNKAGGSSTMKLFFGANADGLTPNETLSGAATGNNATDIRWGGVYMPLPYSVDMDEMASSSADWLGPVSSGVSSIAAVGASVSSPVSWSEGVTKGLGFSVVNAPGLDSRWGGGTNYAAFPNSPIGFYSRNGTGAQTTDVVNLKARIDIPGSQPQGGYANTITITGTTIP